MLPLQKDMSVKQKILTAITKHPKILTFGIVFVASIAMTAAIGITVNNLNPISAAASQQGVCVGGGGSLLTSCNNFAAGQKVVWVNDFTASQSINQYN